MNNERRKRGRPLSVTDAAVIEKVRSMYESNSTQVEIAAHLGLTVKIVQGVMRRHSIKARKSGARDQRREKHPSWKGNQAGYHAFHRRLYAARGAPNKCEVCGTTSAKRFDYANLTGRYEDMDDYKAMCVSCHHRLDKTYLNFWAAENGVVIPDQP